MIPRQPVKSLATNARHVIYVLTSARIADGEGGFSTGWIVKTGDPVWADISPIQARQRQEYQTIGVSATHLVRTTGYVDIGEGDRVRFGTREFDVLTVENLQERDFVQVITCQEDRNAG